MHGKIVEDTFIRREPGEPCQTSAGPVKSGKLAKRIIQSSSFQIQLQFPQKPDVANFLQKKEIGFFLEDQIPDFLFPAFGHRVGEHECSLLIPVVDQEVLQVPRGHLPSVPGCGPTRY